MDQYGWLNRSDVLAVIQRLRGCPGLAKIARSLEVHPPSVVLRTGRRDDLTIRKLNGLVFDWSKIAVGQLSGLRPGSASVLRGHQHAPPRARTRANLVKQHQRTRVRLKQHWIPGKDTGWPVTRVHWR